MIKNIAKCIRFSFPIFGLAILATNFYFYVSKTIWNNHLGYVGLAMLLVSLIDTDRISKLSLGYLKLELQEKIKEADDILEHLKELITPIAEVSMTVAARSNRMGIPPINPERLKKLKQKIEKQLKKIYLVNKFNNKEILSEIFVEYHKYNLWDLSQPIFKKINAKLEQKRHQIANKIKSYPKPVSQDEQYHNLNKTKTLVESQQDDLQELNKQLNFISFRKTVQNHISRIPESIFTEEEKQQILIAVNEDIVEMEKYQQQESCFN